MQARAGWPASQWMKTPRQVEESRRTPRTPELVQGSDQSDCLDKSSSFAHTRGTPELVQAPTSPTALTQVEEFGYYTGWDSPNLFGHFQLQQHTSVCSAQIGAPCLADRFL